MLALLCLAMMTCKKDVEPYVFNAEIKVSDIKAKQVLVEAINDEAGFEKLSAFVYCSTDEKLEESEQYEMTYEDDRFKAYLTELQDGTRYYYKVVFHGKYNSLETEIDVFETETIVLPTVTTSSFLLRVYHTGHRSTTLEVTVSIGVQYFTGATIATRAVYTSVVAIRAWTTTTAATVFQYAQS